MEGASRVVSQVLAQPPTEGSPPASMAGPIVRTLPKSCIALHLNETSAQKLLNSALESKSLMKYILSYRLIPGLGMVNKLHPCHASYRQSTLQDHNLFKLTWKLILLAEGVPG